MATADRIRSDVDTVGGIATRRQLVALGYTGWHLTAAVRLGVIRRIRRGWYATISAPRTGAIAVRVGGRLSHTSAAESFGLWAGLDRRVHLTVTRGASRLRQPSFEARPNIVVHWTRPGRQPLTAPVTWRVDFEECLRGVVRISDEETAIACLDTAMTVYGLTGADIRAIFEEESVESRRVARLAKEGSDSGVESIARQRFETLGLAVEQQIHLNGIGWVDIILDGRLVVEIDGFAFHSDREAVDRDYRRDTELSARRIPHLRFTYRQVMFDWSYVEDSVRACLS